MTKILLTISCLLSFVAHADFFDAQDNYDNGNFKQAFNEFSDLSKLGNRQAQFNIALMNYLGQGTEKNIPTAFAWSRMVEKYHPEFKKLNQRISDEITAADKMESNSIKESLESYSYDKYKLDFGPQKNEGEQISPDFIYFKRSKKAKNKPEYPREVIDEGARGWVDILYNIFLDGSVRNIYVKNQYPHKKFSESAVDFISKQHYVPMKEGNESVIDKPYFNIQRIRYGVQGISGLLSKEQKSYLEELMKSALSGSVESQYKYVKYYNTVLNKSSGVSPFVITNWIFQAAQYGIIDAQFMMGYTLYYGNGCKEDIPKGMTWLQKAAESGQAQASYYLYQILKYENIANHTGQDANYWLTKASELGLIIARYVHAKSLIETSTRLDLAQEHLDIYANEVGKTIDWYLTQAQLFEKTGNKDELKKSVKSGRKLAKKYGWDLSVWEKLQSEI